MKTHNSLGVLNRVGGRLKCSNSEYNDFFNMQYKVNCPSAPFENTMFPTLDDCWTLCIELSEEYGYAEVLFCALNGNQVPMGSYTLGR